MLEFWSRQPFPSSGDLPNLGTEPRYPTLQADSLPVEPQGKTKISKNPGVGSLSLLQWIFPIRESNRGLLHCRWILYQLSYQGSPTSKIHTFKSEESFKRLLADFWSGFSLQIIYSVTRWGCFIWKQQSFLGKGKGSLFSVGIPQKKEKRHTFFLFRQLVVCNPLLSVCGEGLGYLNTSHGEGNGTPLQYSWPGKSHRWRSLVGCSPLGR